MKAASDWEFEHRATVFGLIFGIAFFLYNVDSVNASWSLAVMLAPLGRFDADAVAQGVFGVASLWLAVAAWLRTWASAYLHANVVYASAVKSEDVVADGPYRHLRNPLYFANVLLAIGMGAFMSRIGMLVGVIAMWVFCYRLILREEAGFNATGSQSYEQYRHAVPRWWPSLQARTAASRARAKWKAAFRAEAWCWGWSLAALAFALTLKFWLYLTIVAVSMAGFFFFNRRAGVAPPARTPEARE